MPELYDLLEKTSRTFALSIPELPEPTRRAIGIAYLLFRVADTLEDSTTWPRAERIRALEEFQSLLRPLLAFNLAAAARSQALEAAARLAEAWRQSPPCDHAGYLELLRELPYLVAETLALPADSREAVVRHTMRTADGMAGFIANGDANGHLRLSNLGDLRRYCYTVAGIVGEMICEVFLLDAPQLAPERAILTAHAAAFGEGLQLVNILRDCAGDAREGRVYLPAGVDRADVFALARSDLNRAVIYVNALERARAPRGFIGFTALPVRLAFATLDRVESHGAGAKISRLQVAAIVAEVHGALALGRPVFGSQTLDK